MPLVRLLCLLLASTSAATCSSKPELILFVAPSLARTMYEVEQRFIQSDSKARIRTDISGSQVAARKLTELNMRADVLALADSEVIEKMLIPAHAAWSIRFATNSIVIAHLGHSRFTEEITSTNWPEILTRPGVRLGLANPDTAPIGYRALMVWQPAAAHYGRPSLETDLRRQVAPAHLMSDEAELWALLAARAVDYVFLYRSTAEEHRLKTTPLPAEINLSEPALAANYAMARVPVLMQRGAASVIMPGVPVYFGITIPNDAPHPELAVKFIAFFLSETGKAVLTRAGFTPLTPALAMHQELLPAALKSMTMVSP
jgi:molybdate/tungstate transport system substrate-binding protein